MLKTAIIYHMGSAGTFLNRVLALSEKTIPLIPQNCKINQSDWKLSANERFEIYNQFDKTDWRSSEYSVILQYRWGHGDFIQYVQSNLWLIDSWHPHIFEQEAEKEILWTKNEKWHHILFIDCDRDDVTFINSKTINKNYPRNEPYMFESMNRLYQQYPDAIHLPFKAFLDQSMFLSNISRIDTMMDLNLDIELVSKLYNRWYEESIQCWNINPSELNPKDLYGHFWKNPSTK
jgi:hypothetical protein